MIAQTMKTIELETVPRETVRRTLCIKKEAGYLRPQIHLELSQECQAHASAQGRSQLKKLRSPEKSIPLVDSLKLQTC